MRLLLAITICSFCAVMWVALALARRIKRSQITALRRGRRPTAQDSRLSGLVGQEFFEAGEFRTPRPLRLDQEILRQSPRRPISEMTFRSSEADVPFVSHSGSTSPSLNAVEPLASLEGQRTAVPIPIDSSAAYTSLFGRSVSVARLGANLHLDAPVSAKVSEVSPSVPVVPIASKRNPPQIAQRSGLRRRVDLSQYNKNVGDLADPYTNPLRGSGTQGPVPADRASH